LKLYVGRGKTREPSTGGGDDRRKGTSGGRDEDAGDENKCREFTQPLSVKVMAVAE